MLVAVERQQPVPNLPSPLVELDDERFTKRGLRLWVKREDLIHPTIPGNKWRKLVPNIQAARQQGHQRLLTFGGAWSNHIHAVAVAGPLFGFETIGVIRGEEHLPLNPVLSDAIVQGMQLTYLDRTTYRHKHTPEVIEQLHQEHGDFYLVPEGGTNALAIRSCREIATELRDDIDVVGCAVGTGGTLAGIAAGLHENQKALGVSALKGADYLDDEVKRLQEEAFGAATRNWHIDHNHHCGGFAKRTPSLDAFISDFKDRHGIALEWIYVAKMLYAVVDLAKQGNFPSGTQLAAIVTGPPTYS